MEHTFEPFIERSGVVILDGAMATELERRGADLNDPLWSAKVLLESPGMILDVHRDYFDAGADVAITASYQATFEGLAGRGLSRAEASEVLARSVRMAHEAREAFWANESVRKQRVKPLIAGSVGCYGAFLADGSEFRGEYGLGVPDLMNFHRDRMRVLVEAGADILACETIPSRVEAEALIELLAEFPDVPAWLTFSCRDGAHISEGATIAECVGLAESSPSVVAVGVNCTAPRYISSLIRSMRESTAKPLVVYPNLGESWDAEKKRWMQDADVASLRQPAREWYDLGARIIGGCCRTTPEMIREIAAELRAESEL